MRSIQRTTDRHLDPTARGGVRNLLERATPASCALFVQIVEEYSEASDARRVGLSLHRDDKAEDRSFNEAARELEQLQMAFAVLASRPAAGNQEHGADTTDEPDLTSTLRGSNPQRFAARGGDNRLATLNSDEDEQDVDDATPKHLDPRSRIGAIAERMLSLHILAFAVRYRARRYA